MFIVVVVVVVVLILALQVCKTHDTQQRAIKGVSLVGAPSASGRALCADYEPPADVKAGKFNLITHTRAYVTTYTYTDVRTHPLRRSCVCARARETRKPTTDNRRRPIDAQLKCASAQCARFVSYVCDTKSNHFLRSDDIQADHNHTSHIVSFKAKALYYREQTHVSNNYYSHASLKKRRAFCALRRHRTEHLNGPSRGIVVVVVVRVCANPIAQVNAA